MATRFSKRLKHAWNLFSYETETRRAQVIPDLGPANFRRPDRGRMYLSNERSFISSIYTRIGIDAASFEMKHIRTDDLNRYLSDMQTGLNNCLTLEANIDQAATQFRQDAIMTIIERGVAAIVPVDTTINPFINGGFDIKTLRVGHIINWYPQYVRVSVYNDKTGLREELTLPKATTAIIENPLYSIMNEPNSTLQRLIRKLNMLDDVDEQSSSGKLDLIIQLPYVIKSEARRQAAEQRRSDIEFQLKGSQYGIAYTDGTEKITQLNRPATNNLMDQVTYLTDLLYTQLGLTPNVMNGTALEPEMLNYWARTIEPILNAVTEELRRKFLTKTARSQSQDVRFFRNVFKIIPLSGDGGIADILDKLSRDEILAQNEARDIIGYPPLKGAAADIPNNANMPAKNPLPTPPEVTPKPAPVDVTDDQNGKSPIPIERTH